MALLSDTDELKNLMALYCFAVDDRDFGLLERIVAEDVMFDVPPDLISGRYALLSHVQKNIWPQGKHVTINPTFEISGDVAVSKSDWVWIDPSLKVSNMGRYQDEFIRSDGRWLFKVRRVEWFTAPS